MDQISFDAVNDILDLQGDLHVKDFVFCEEYTFGFERLYLPFFFFVRESCASLNAWDLLLPTLDTATFCVGILVVGIRLVEGDATLFFNFVRKNIVKQFPLMTCSLYFLVFQYTIAALPSFGHMWTYTTILLAKSCLVSM